MPEDPYAEPPITYAELMDMMDDRDDSGDPEFRDPDGYCEHGTYVGGCGIDWMCQWCEDGISAAEAKKIVASQRLAGIRDRAQRAEKWLNTLLIHGVGGIDATWLAQDSSHVGNPRSRYGRH